MQLLATLDAVQYAFNFTGLSSDMCGGSKWILLHQVMTSKLKFKIFHVRLTHYLPASVEAFE